MKKLIVCCFIFMLGCSSYQLDEKLTSLPILLEHSELPQIPKRIYDPEFRLIIKMLVDENGRVAKAQLIDGSGLPEWDSLAITSIKKWKYEPARFEERPISLWLIQKVRVQFENPYYLLLSQIMCDSYDKAVFVITKLNEGVDFGELASKYSCDSSKIQNGFIGKKDVLLYPPQINGILKRLAVDQYTQPMEFGKRYVIFKRMKNQ